MPIGSLLLDQGGVPAESAGEVVYHAQPPLHPSSTEEGNIILSFVNVVFQIFLVLCPRYSVLEC